MGPPNSGSGSQLVFTYVKTSCDPDPEFVCDPDPEFYGPLCPVALLLLLLAGALGLLVLALLGAHAGGARCFERPIEPSPLRALVGRLRMAALRGPGTAIAAFRAGSGTVPWLRYSPAGARAPYLSRRQEMADARAARPLRALGQ